jgi:hypothetical protein
VLLRIRPGLARAWRAPGRLQIGLDPRCGVVLDGLTAADERVLAALDAGTYDRRRLQLQAARWGLPRSRVDDLVRLLDDAGVLLPDVDPSPVLARLDDRARTRLEPTARALAVAHPGSDGWEAVARRLRARVVVQGGCRVGLRVATTLAASGTGAVEVHDDEPVAVEDAGPGAYLRPDVGRRRGRAAADRLARVLALPPAPTEVVDALPDAVVVVGSGALDPGGYDPWLALDVPHLAVLVRECDAVVGPLVRAGRGCCLRCVELYRTDRDPEWPRVAAQVATGWTGRCDPVVGEQVAALAAAEVLALVDGWDEPLSTGRTLEVGPGRTVPVVRTWPAHARCGCLALPPVGGGPESPRAPAGGATSMMGR